jgi:hypothetical protein
MSAAIPYVFPAVTDESDPGLRVCPWCGSPNVVVVEWYGPTGVVSPDGVEEYQTQVGYKCDACGEIEEM